VRSRDPATSFPVEAGNIMCFARACGDANPAFDPTVSDRGGAAVLAPLTFVQAREQYRPDSALRPRDGAPWPPPREGDGVRLHAEQHFEYRRAVRAGDVLTARPRSGRSWEKPGRRGGTLSFTETVTELRDAGGELVVIARALSVLTSQAVR
jgi:hypothetical protein